MGGWFALKLAHAQPDWVRSLVLLAPGVDFTRRVWTGLPETERQAATRGERVLMKTEWSREPYELSARNFSEVRVKKKRMTR